MANVFEGYLTGKDLKIGIVVARFNEFITNKLLGGAIDTLRRHETCEENIDVAWVPGAFEIPLVAKKMAESGKYDAVICLGAVIRSRFDKPLRLCMQRSFQRRGSGRAAKRCSDDFRRRYDGKYRTGYRTRRHESRQQRR